MKSNTTMGDRRAVVCGRGAALAASVLAVCAGAALGGGGQSGRVEVIAAAGEGAPGLAGVTMSEVSSPRVVGSGRVAYWARLSGKGVTASNNAGVVVGMWGGAPGAEPGGFGVGARTGQATSGDALSSLADVLLSRTGRVNVTGTAGLGQGTAAPVPPRGVFEVTEGTALGTRFLEGALIGGARVDEMGHAAVMGTGGELGLVLHFGRAVVERDGEREVVIQRGEAPGLEGLDVYAPGRPSLDGRGNAAVVATLVAATGPVSSGKAVYADFGAGPELLMREGDAAPGGGVFRALSMRPVLDDAGGVTVWATRESETGTAGTQGLYRWRDGVVSALVLTGDAAPGTGGGVFERFSTVPSVGDAGEMAVMAFLVRGSGITSENDAGVWRWSASGAGQLVARRGAQAPGFESGWTFLTFNDPVVMGGRTAFMARVRGPAAGDLTRAALYVAGPTGVELVARTGDTVTLPGGTEREVREVNFESASDRDGTGVAVAGPGGADTLVFGLRFTDDSTAVAAYRAGCAADLNGDGVVNTADVTAYLSLWFEARGLGVERAAALRARADLDANGQVNTADVTEFLSWWFAARAGGC